MKIVIEDPQAFPTERSTATNGFRGYESDDGGAYLTHRVADGKAPLYVDVKSSTDKGDGPNDGHKTFMALGGKRLRITIETIEEGERSVHTKDATADDWAQQLIYDAGRQGAIKHLEDYIAVLASLYPQIPREKWIEALRIVREDYEDADAGFPIIIDPDFGR